MTQPVHETGHEQPAAWLEQYERLDALEPSRMSPQELDCLADAAWWLCLPEESIAARQRAYTGHAEAGDRRASARSAWRLFSDHHYALRPALADGWLRRARRHLEALPECPEHGLLALAEAELCLGAGDFEDAERHAARATEVGESRENLDTVAMGLQLRGRALLGQGKVGQGFGLLDEAMCLVLVDQLSPMFTGWVYCAVLGACRDRADLSRASEWTAAARVWCLSLPFQTPYHGICRVFRGELLALRGGWEEAEAELRQAEQELLAHKPHEAAEASYLAGEINRRRGDLDAAERAFERARDLGQAPQPGLALLRLTQGRADIAAASLATALADPRCGPVGRAQLLAARIEVAIAERKLELADATCEELEALAAKLDSASLRASAALSRARLESAVGDHVAALRDSRAAMAAWHELGFPYEAATARLLAGSAAVATGDEESGRLEVEAACRSLERLGAVADSRAAVTQLDAESPPRGLTRREVEVLRLVAAGRSNREIAATLTISEHTAARHVQNIFAKLGVSSRAAAAAAAVETGLA